MESKFINYAFDNAIKSYIKDADKNEIVGNSFILMVLKMLASIYGEVDIINPYLIKNENSFMKNIIKFGYTEEKYIEFVDNFKKYYEIETKNNELNVKINNPYFVIIQKQLIDMFCLKKKNFYVSNMEQKDFFDLLYTSKTTNPLRSSYNFLTASDPNEVENYFYEQVDKCYEKEAPKEKNVLNIEAYEILNYSLTDIATMDHESVDKINENVYNFFEIDKEAENKNDLLNLAVLNYKRYNSKLTSGNGYVDILLVMGIVVTVILVLIIITLIFI